MHMADALLSPTVGVAFDVVSVGAMGFSVSKVKKDEFSDKKIPLMGVAGALVFAAQMINFTIPATGSSGHIGGGILLAGLLGGVPAFLSISAVLIIQSLFFADGGLLALGCNIFNMGIIPCLIIYPLVFRPLLKKGITRSRLSVASIVSVILALQLGALSVVFQTLASGVTELPAETFAAFMLPIHLAIGLVEGIVTAGVLCFVWQMRPEILESANIGKPVSPAAPFKKVLVTFALAAMVVGGALSVFASSYPDGLEWSVERVAGTSNVDRGGAIHNRAAAVQERTSFLPNYGFGGANEDSGNSGTSASGLVGAGISFILAGATGFTISKLKKAKKRPKAVPE
jgi:cobalt/nickel transport system permease protein